MTAVKKQKKPFLTQKELQNCREKARNELCDNGGDLYVFPNIERDIEGFEKMYDDFRERA
jgi:hypothetical protein